MRNLRTNSLRAPTESSAPESISSIVILPMDKDYELNRWLCVTALFMASLNLRPIVSSIAPVLGSIQHDLDLSGAVSSLLVSIPVLCMGILAPFSVKLSEKLGGRAGHHLLLNTDWGKHTFTPVYPFRFVVIFHYIVIGRRYCYDGTVVIRFY